MESNELDQIIQNCCYQIVGNKNLYNINNLNNLIINNNMFPIQSFDCKNCILILLRLLCDLKYTDCNINYTQLLLLFSIIDKYNSCLDTYNDNINECFIYKKNNIRYIIFSIQSNKKNYFVYNLLDDKDNIVYLYNCQDIKNFDMNFQTIKQFNIPRLVVKKDFLKSNNNFNGKFKNILNLLYNYILSIFYKNYCQIQNKNDFTDKITSLIRKNKQSYPEDFFQNDNIFEKIDIQNISTIYGFRTYFTKSKKKLGSDECSKIYLDFLSLD